MTEYCIDGSSLDPYTSTKTALYETISFEPSGKCTISIHGREREYDFSFDGKSLITVGSLVKFKIVHSTGMTLILAVDVEGDNSAKSVYEYDRGDGRPVIYSNYTSFEGTENRCFWYLEGRKKHFCYPIIATTQSKQAYDQMSKTNNSLPFYDQARYHFKKSR